VTIATVDAALAAVTPFTKGIGRMTEARYAVLLAIAEEIFKICPGKNLTGDLAMTAKAYIIAHLHVSIEGDLDKASVNTLNMSWTRNGAVPPEKTSYWLSMEQIANLQKASTAGGSGRGDVLVQRNDISNDSFRLDNLDPVDYPVDVNEYTGGG